MLKVIENDTKHETECKSLLDELARAGIAVLLVSSELQEILGVADRTLVLHEGRVAGILTGSEMSEEAIMRLATGGVDPEVEAAA